MYRKPTDLRGRSLCFSIPKSWGKRSVIGLTIALLALSVDAAIAQPPPAQPLEGGGQGPDVLAIVMRGPGGVDMVSMTYPKVIPPTQAARDVAALAQDANLGAVNVDVSNEPVGLAKIKTDPITSVSFEAKGMLPDENHETAFRLDPWVLALKNYHSVTITYLMQRDFGFNGLRDYKDDNVAIELDRHGNAYTYRVAIANPNFDHINLPFLQADSDQAKLASNLPSRRPWYIAGFVAVSAIAAGFGYGVWAVLSRLA